jgi:5-methyltetrahydrofolate--homocysteine methyltransferase
MTDDFLNQLSSREILISDGATGTNLQARGLERGLPSEIWVIEKPEMIVRLHNDFIDSGSDILLTSTFGANRYRISSSLAEQVNEVNQLAVGLARQAIEDRDIFIAGSIGPLGKLLDPYGPLSYGDALSAYNEQATALDQAGVDLIVIETQFDINEARAAIEAVRSVSNLPLVCSFSFDRGKHTMMGVSPTNIAEELADSGIDIIGINCGRSLEDNVKALEELRQVTDLPIWFKPNAGLPVMDESGNTNYTVTPQEMGKAAEIWIDFGANIIGGCCGTTPEHLKYIAATAGAR